MTFWQRFWRRKTKTAVSPVATPAPPTDRILINIPTLIDPAERRDQYAQPLSDLLLEKEAGRLIEQRNWLQKKFSGLAIVGGQLVVETAVLERTLPLIHTFLVENECPAETVVVLFSPEKRQLLVYKDLDAFGVE